MKLNELKSAARAILNPEAMKTALIRRKVLFGAGGLAGASVIALSVTSGGSRIATPVGPIDKARAKPLGDGFYLADGWILSADDLNIRDHE